MNEPEQSKMGEYLRAVCKQARIDAGRSVARVAVAHTPEVKQSQTLAQWEDGEIGWPRDVDERVRAYSSETGVPSWELWQMAINLWQASQVEVQDASPQSQDKAAQAHKLSKSAKSVRPQTEDRRQRQ